ncbi:hypothetical protein CHU98_g4657 [Xylaria longipes]|nr:hypothetical protein CHU98_g4657 [Xylaria longipes]
MQLLQLAQHLVLKTWEYRSFFEFKRLGFKILSLVIPRILFTLQMYAVERLFVARQELIVRIGRATQRLLFLPKVLWIVSEEEPGLSRHAIRNSANFLGIPLSASAVVLYGCWLDGINILQDLWAFILGLALPTSCVLGVWIVLARSQHFRSKHPAPSDPEKGGAKPFNKYGLDEDGARIIEGLWTKQRPDIFTGQGNGSPNNTLPIPPSIDSLTYLYSVPMA